MVKSTRYLKHILNSFMKDAAEADSMREEHPDRARDTLLTAGLRFQELALAMRHCEGGRTAALESTKTFEAKPLSLPRCVSNRLRAAQFFAAIDSRLGCSENDAKRRPPF